MSDLDLDAIREHFEKAREWMHREWDVLPLLAREHFADVHALLAEVERLKANQPDGGEWRVEYGYLWGGKPYWPLPTVNVPAALMTHQRRVWYGPVEPVAEAAE